MPSYYCTAVAGEGTAGKFYSAPITINFQVVLKVKGRYLLMIERKCSKCTQ